MNRDSLLGVAYRPTERTEARRAQVRERIVEAARDLIARGGYAEARISAVADRAGIATGTVYRHFPSKTDLFAEVFREASQHEVDAMAAAAEEVSEEGAAAQIATAVETFARRALRGRRLAYALIAEPVDPVVEAERLALRRSYRDVLARIVAAGVASGELPSQDSETSGAALVGAIAEALVGPVSPAAAERDRDAQVGSLVEFCIRSVTGREPAHVSA
jgi:AcrR family transcriptional regulator